VLHLRVIAPTTHATQVVTLLREHPAVAHLVVMPGAAQVPAGDLILCDLAREGANPILDQLRTLGITSSGAITVEDTGVILSEAAERADARAPGLGEDAVVWDDIAHRTGQETRLSATYLVLLTVAMIIASVGVLMNQPILVVGAMVVGPEFGPLAALSVGLVRRDWQTVRRSTVALVVGFPAAMAVTVLATVAMAAAGLVSKDMLLADRPLVDFIWRPDALSWIVGFLAGVAGIISLTSSRAGPLIGVLISVTTVPAAANAAVALAFGVPTEARGAAIQLAINLAAIVAAGALTLLIQRLWWRRIATVGLPANR